MRTNRFVWKAVSVVLAMALVITMLPANVANNKISASAASGEIVAQSFEDDSMDLSIVNSKTTDVAQEGLWVVSSTTAANANKLSTSFVSTASDGDSALCVTTTNTTGTIVYLQTYVEDLEYGVDYTISYDVYNAGTSTSANAAFAYFSTSSFIMSTSTSSAISTSSTVPTLGEWVQVIGTFNTEKPSDATSDTYSGYVGLRLNAAAVKKIAYIDNFKVTTNDNVVIIDGEDLGSFETYSDWHWTSSASAAKMAQTDLSTQDWYGNASYDGNKCADFYDSGLGNYAYVTTTIPVLAAGDYVASFYSNGYYSEIGVVIFNENGDQVLLTDAGRSMTTSPTTWKWTLAEVRFSLDKELEYADIGLYAKSTATGAWCKIDGFTLEGPESSSRIRYYRADNVQNGDFETGDLRKWTIDEAMDDDSGEFHYAYTIKDGTTDEAQYNTTKFFDWYNNESNGSTDTFVLTMHQNIIIQNGGTYHLWGETMGSWAEDAVAIEVYSAEATYDADSPTIMTDITTGDMIASVSLDSSGSWTDWVYRYSDGFELKEGDLIQVYFLLASDYTGSPYGDIDNIKLVASENLNEQITDFQRRNSPDKTGKFANASFATYSFGGDGCWTGTGDNDETNWNYGYAFTGYGNLAEIAYLSDGTTEDSDNSTYNACLNVYNNSTTYNSRLTFSQSDIILNEQGDYAISCYMKGYLGDDGVTEDAGVFVTVTDEDGNVLCTSQLTPYSNDVWRPSKTDGFTVSQEQLEAAEGTYKITVTVSVKMPLVHDEEGDDGNTFTCYPSVSFDDFLITAPDADEAVAVENEEYFKGVTYRNAEGSARYVNGGNSIVGADVSAVIALENAGVTYKNLDGEEEDIFEILADNGVNYIRARVWNDPFDVAGNGYGGGNCDVDVLTAIAKRCAAAGLSLYIDFHYSDAWADPGNQRCPKAWASYDINEKCTALAAFTSETLEAVAATGVNIGIVSIGNETNNGAMAGETSLENFKMLVNAASSTIRGIDSNIMVALHFAPTEGGWLEWEYTQLGLDELDFDIFAASCYPYYDSHSDDGTITRIVAELNAIAAKYGKLTMLAEYDWPYTWVDTDNYATGQISKDYGYIMNWDVSVDGQAAMMQDIIKASNAAYTGYNVGTADYGLVNCIGSFYWEGTWIGVDDTTAWDTYGVGVWTAAAQVAVDGATTGSTQGNVHDILTFFDEDGNALESIKAFSTVTETSPIEIALVQTSSVADSKYNLRMVGTVDENSLLWRDDASVGFRVIVYNEDKEIIKTVSDKTTAKLYSSIKANGEMVTPEEGKYFYTYTYKNIPADSTYYFQIMSNAEDTWAYHQEASKVVKVNNGVVTLVDSATFEEITETSTDSGDDYDTPDIEFGDLVD